MSDVLIFRQKNSESDSDV